MKQIATFLFSIVLVCSFQNSKANLICVTSGGTTTLYTSLDSAILAAPSGAFIYLSGGIFPLDSNTTISKPLNFVGAGYRPDSTLVTGKTFISSESFGIDLNDGSDQSTFTGIDFIIPNITATNQTSFTNITFSRCIFDMSLFYTNIQINPRGNVFTLSECVINTQFTVGNNVHNGTANPCTFDRCLFYVNPLYIDGSTFRHCSFVENFPVGFNLLEGRSTIVFTDCAFFNTNMPAWNTTVANSVNFTNCITTDSVLPPNSVNTNCLLKVNPSLFYTNVVGTTFLYTNNYQLISGSPGHNFATDGTDVGIYGSAFPFKTGAVPYNPHFSSGTLPLSTDGSGNLNVTLTVGAQSR